METTTYTKPSARRYVEIWLEEAIAAQEAGNDMRIRRAQTMLGRAYANLDTSIERAAARAE
jgi:hypothetical protein